MTDSECAADVRGDPRRYRHGGPLSWTIREQAPAYGQRPRLLGHVRLALRARHYSARTETAYANWVRQFVVCHGRRHPAETAEPEINAVLTHLAVRGRVSASTQDQALPALLFLCRHVLRRDIGDLGHVIRARRPQRLPVVLTREEAKAVLANLAGDKWLMASLRYGAGPGLVQRVIEASGIPTVAVSMIPDLTRAVGVPRLAGLSYPMSRPLGRPHDADGQRAVLRAMLGLLASASAPDSYVELPFQCPESSATDRNASKGLAPPPIVELLQRKPSLLARLCSGRIPHGEG